MTMDGSMLNFMITIQETEGESGLWGIDFICLELSNQRI